MADNFQTIAREKAFAIEYVKDWNATKAVKRLKLSEEVNPSQYATRMLKKPRVRDFIQKHLEEAEEIGNVTINRVLNAFANLGFSDVRGFFNENGTMKRIDELTSAQAAAIASYEVICTEDGDVIKKIKLWDKPRALESLAKHLGFYEADNKQRRDINSFAINNIRIILPGEADNNIDVVALNAVNTLTQTAGPVDEENSSSDD